jgi:acyl-CoA thioesterase
MDKTEIIKRINEKGPFTRHNNILITDIGGGSAEGEMAVTAKSLNHYGGVHGGALYSLADFVAGVAAASRKTVCVTLNASIHYFKAVYSGKVKAVAREVNRTNKTGLYEVMIFDSEGNLAAKAECTYYDTGVPLSDKKTPSNKNEAGT